MRIRGHGKYQTSTTRKDVPNTRGHGRTEERRSQNQTEMGTEVRRLGTGKGGWRNGKEGSRRNMTTNNHKYL